MFVFPVNAASELVRNNIEVQSSLLLNVSKSFVNASMQLGELNVQASRKLVEESTAAMMKSMQLKSLADAQSFIAEQSQMTLDRIRGYQQNVQNIAAATWRDAGKVGGEPVTAQSVNTGNAGGAADTAAPKDAASHGQHETDHRPSPLVEKLVASVVSGTDKPH